MDRRKICYVVAFFFLTFGVFGVLSYIQYSSVFYPKPYFSGEKIQHQDTSRTFVGREYSADSHVFHNHNPDKKMAIEWQVAIGAVLITALISALVYLFTHGKDQGKDIAVLQTSMIGFKEDVAEMKTDLTEIRNGQRALDNKVNLFLKSEIDTIKELARARHNGA